MNKILMSSGGAVSLGLKTNLVASWELNEASGNALDSHTNALTLTDTNTVTSGTGVGGTGTARQFTLANTEYFVRTSEALLQMGDVDWAGCCWFNRDSNDAQFLFTKDDVVANREFDLGWEAAGNSMTFRVFKGAGSTGGTINITTVAPGTWQFIMFWFTAADNKIYISLDNGTVSETTMTGDAISGSAKFAIGGRPDGGGINPFNGRIQAFRLWKNFTPTAGNITSLYNGGVVVPYANL